MIASFLLVGDQQPYAAQMVASLKQLACPIIQMSDLTTPPVVGVDEVVRLPFRIPLMLYRLRHLAQYKHTQMLIVDTDVLCKASVDDVWDRPFDVALTVRDHPQMPFNTGVMFSRSNAFWAAAYAWLALQDADLQRWYGDQHAVAAVTSGFNVLSLSCDEFNWSPSRRDDTSSARFWHYKGAIRKKWLI